MMSMIVVVRAGVILGKISGGTLAGYHIRSFGLLPTDPIHSGPASGEFVLTKA